ncbi:MAG: type II toxin-antitoxin system HicA family toxin [Synergistaceae bacterium]|nr:type II toxin-antitoxin system HicA family toxin [Synergistaceae bacterium]
MPRWKELKRFLDLHGEHVRSGKHEIYKYQGRQIRVSHSSGEISPDMWRSILKKELRMTQEEFYAGL